MVAVGLLAGCGGGGHAPATDAGLGSPSLVVTPDPLTMIEGRPATVALVLSRAPAAQVTVSWSSTGSVLASGSTLFDASNWSAPQSITVMSPRNGRGEAGSGYLVFTGTLGESRLAVTVANDEEGGLFVSPAARTLDETGAAGTFVAHFDLTTSREIVVAVRSSDPTVATVSPSELHFAADETTVRQTVTVTPVVDADGFDESVTVELVPTAGPAIAALVSVRDTASMPALVLTPAAVTVMEDATTPGRVAVGLDTPGDVDLTLTPLDPGVVVVSPTTLHFTRASVAAQEVQLRAVSDFDMTSEMTSVVVSGPGITSRSIQVTTLDDTDQKTMVTPANGLTVPEGGSATFTVRMSAEPGATILLALQSDDSTRLTMTPASLQFSDATFMTAQTVTVQAAEDADASSEHRVITLSSPGNTPSETLAVHIQDND